MKKIILMLAMIGLAVSANAENNIAEKYSNDKGFVQCYNESNHLAERRVIPRPHAICAIVNNSRARFFFNFSNNSFEYWEDGVLIITGTFQIRGREAILTCTRRTTISLGNLRLNQGGQITSATFRGVTFRSC